MRKILKGLFLVTSVVLLSACDLKIFDGGIGEAFNKNSNGPLDGEDYAGPIGARWQSFGGNATILRFEKNSIIQVEDGEEVNSGTYEIDNDELTFNLDGNTVRAVFLTEDHMDDREIFTVTSADGLLGMLTGLSFSILTTKEKEYIENYELVGPSEETKDYKSDSLNGNYTGIFGLQYEENQRTIRFDGESVTTIQEGEITNSGTYEIDDDKLIISMNGIKIRSILQDDKKSFTVKSADGLLDVISGITFTKETES
ncbi:MAG: hypothetical protein L0L57_05320 [Alkalibacterium sp.]|nr:hypothetical protein [Alkalibacterium sp.]